MAHYSEILNADGTYNLPAIMQIAWLKARHERNAEICDREEIKFSAAHGKSLGDAASFYAAEVAKMSFPPFVSTYQKFVTRELRKVWAIARGMKEAREAQAAFVASQVQSDIQIIERRAA